jgi:hypothetical protein
MLFVVEHGGVQDHLIDVALQGISPIIPTNRRRRILTGSSGLRLFRGGNRIAIDIERWLFLRLYRRSRLPRRSGRHLRHG